MLIDAVKNEITAGEVKHDITESMLELATDVCRDINPGCRAVFSDAESRIAGSRRPSSGNLRRWHAPVSEMAASGGMRQRTLSTNAGKLWLSHPAGDRFGQHVHVGCASGDDAIYLLHGLSRFVPHFIALSAASPYMQGTDTRFASSRPNIFPPFPIMARCRGSVTGNNLKPCFAA